jgi:outer membrane lipoprotein-sorting protein
MKNLNSRIFTSFVFLFLATASDNWAQDAKVTLTVDGISQKVAEAQSKVQDVQMDLTMQMQDVLSGKTQQVEGSVKLKSPNLVYAHYRKPSEQFLYIDGDLIQMYQPGQNMVYQQKAPEGAGAGPIYLGVGQELKRYIDISRVSIIQNSSDQVVLLFIPKSSDAAFTRMKVSIHKKDWWPYRMEVETPALVTKSEFSNFRFNQGIDSKVFQFVTPRGADVVQGAIF